MTSEKVGEPNMTKVFAESFDAVMAENAALRAEVDRLRDVILSAAWYAPLMGEQAAILAARKGGER